MHIELDADGYNRCMTETLTAEHKQIFLQFIRAERNFLDRKLHLATSDSNKKSLICISIL